MLVTSLTWSTQFLREIYGGRYGQCFQWFFKDGYALVISCDPRLSKPQSYSKALRGTRSFYNIPNTWWAIYSFTECGGNGNLNVIDGQALQSLFKYLIFQVTCTKKKHILQLMKVVLQMSWWAIGQLLETQSEWRHAFSGILSSVTECLIEIHRRGV